MSEIVVSDWHGVRDAFRRPELRQALYDDGALVMGGCLLDLHGIEHRDRRRVENRLFRRATFERWEYEVLRPTIDGVLSHVDAGESADLVDLGYRLATNLTASISGIDVEPGDAERTELIRSVVSKLSEGATAAHSTRDPAELRAEVQGAMDVLERELFRPAAERRRDRPGPASDVLGLLLQHEEGLGLDAESIRREIGFYLQAGAHSTANALVHSFHLLFSWASSVGRPLTELASDLDLLQRVVHEGLRLYPASPVALRRALEPCRVRTSTGELRVESGEVVVLDLTAANRDQEVFGATADRFDPDREVPDGIPRWGSSFGGGIHTCIGQELDGGVPPEHRGTGRPL